MQVRRNELIEGFPVLKIRALLRRSDTLSPTLVQNSLGLPSRKAATSVLRSLEAAGLVRREETVHGERWDITEHGSRLRLATAAKPIRRGTADRLVSDLLKRVTLINEEAVFRRRVAEVVVFGSYLTDTQRLGDLDV